MKSLSKLHIGLASVIYVFNLSYAISSRLLVSNSGPATLGSNITFTALLEDYATKSELTFKFEDGIQNREYIVQSLNVITTLAFTSDFYMEGMHCMNISVEKYELLWKETIASNHSCFSLRRSLVGKISVHRGNASFGDDTDKVAVGENVTIVLDFHDPNEYLKGAMIDYGWSIDMQRHRTLDNILIYNFSQEGEKEIKAIATATLQNGETKFGYFEKMITAEVPVNLINISGNPFLHHGDLLLLNISCSGTPPFGYCAEILKPNTSVQNFTCRKITWFNTCHMKIRKFLLDGKYQMGIYINNDVKEVRRVIEVMVYNVTIKPTLSTVIIPIVCSLLTLIIIAMGISYCIQQRNQLAVEVANFDFQDDSDSYTERTFFEKIFDSVTCKNCRNPRFSCSGTRTESDPLLYDEFQPCV